MVKVYDYFPAVCKARGLGEPVTEFRFKPPRRWRFDYCWPDERVALECEGGIWTQGRHTRGAGYERDMEKYNAAALDGWLVLRTTPKALGTLATLEMVATGLAVQRAAAIAFQAAHG